MKMVAEEVRSVASQLAAEDLDVMRRDIREALARNEVGMECDRREWEHTLDVLDGLCA